MVKLNNSQIEFIINTFFGKDFNGYRNIAESLLKDGECVVGGSERLWVGGIGNFIKTEIANGYINCLKYTFNIDEFLSSAWFKELCKLHMEETLTKKNEIEHYYSSLEELFNS